MKKIKWTILSLAVIFSITAAFSTKPHFVCDALQQYYWTGSGYMPVNPSYGCTQSLSTCTYTTTNGITFTPCIAGTYVNCFGCAVEEPQAKK